MDFKWKILELFAKGKGVKYFVEATDGENTITHEGNYWFPEGKFTTPVDQLKEKNLIDWIEKDTILSDLEAQLKSLEDNKNVELPWLANTFTV